MLGPQQTCAGTTPTNDQHPYNIWVFDCDLAPGDLNPLLLRMDCASGWPHHHPRLGFDVQSKLGSEILPKHQAVSRSCNWNDL